MIKKEELLCIEGSVDLRSVKWKNPSSDHLMLHNCCTNGLPASEGLNDLFTINTPLLILS